MADVEVNISDVTIIAALNTPGGPVFRWRDETAELTIRIGQLTGPINDPLNARHRGGVVGTYVRSFGYDRVGSNGHQVRATITNDCDHADIVELGRHHSSSFEIFSWRSAVPPGAIIYSKRGTGGREGKHVLERAANAAVQMTT